VYLRHLYSRLRVLYSPVPSTVGVCTSFGALFITLVLAFKSLKLIYSRLIYVIGYRLFFQNIRRGGGGGVEAILPALLRSASTTHSLWTIIFGDLCQTAIRSFHMPVPLPPSNVGPLGYVLDSKLTKVVAILSLSVFPHIALIVFISVCWR
jgi:hypothetical protein